RPSLPVVTPSGRARLRRDRADGCRVLAETAGPHGGISARTLERREELSMISDLAFARSQMALSLAFHIVFAAVGIGMPLLMAVAEALYLRSREPVYLDLARRWASGTAILFAVGAVSGTVLSFELGLLWPGFMQYAGGIIGLPFSLEGFAFFTEAIFLGIYLYGWDRIPAVLHWLAGIVVAA